MIEENKSSLPGVTLITSSAREYTMPGIASHILGTVGRISAEEYETLSSKGYLFDDIVGKDGIEKVCEDYLRGQNGYRYTINDDSGTVVSDIGDLASEEGYASVDAKSGFDVILTIDSKMKNCSFRAAKSTARTPRPPPPQYSWTPIRAKYLPWQATRLLT